MAVGGPSAADQFVIGVSNTHIGNSWREEFVCSIKAEALASGLVSKIVLANREAGPSEQIGETIRDVAASQNVITIAGGGSLMTAGASDGEVFAVVHPRTVALFRTRPDGTPRNVWEGRAVDLDFEGDRVRVRLEGTPAIVAEVTPAAVHELSLGRGDPVWVAVKATEVDVYPA